jgi:hypothetical protein
MKTFIKARKFLAVAVATLALGSAFIAASSPASADDCYSGYSYHSHYHYSSNSYGYSNGY